MLSHYKKYLKWLLDRKTDLEKPQPAGVKSFSWTGSQSQKEELYEALKVAGYIDKETSKESFAMVFADEINISEAIRWNGSNRLLAYLFNQLNSGNNPLIISREWQSIIEKSLLFKNQKGKLIKAGDLATALSAINGPDLGINPKGSNTIDAILKNIKTLRP